MKSPVSVSIKIDWWTLAAWGQRIALWAIVIGGLGVLLWYVGGYCGDPSDNLWVCVPWNSRFLYNQKTSEVVAVPFPWFWLNIVLAGCALWCFIALCRRAGVVTKPRG